MVSNDRSFSAPVASRNCSRRVTISTSSGSRSWPSVPSQCRKRLSAAPSRAWARRAPSTSTAFLQARGRAVGSLARTISAPAARRVSKYQEEDWAESTSTRRPRSSARAVGRASGLSSRTWLPSQAGSSAPTLAGSRNSRAEPSASRIAWPSGRGERITSPPRMLNSQATEAGAVITAASAPASARLAPTRARLAADSSPANSSGWGTTGATGWGGRPAQAASSGLSSTGVSRAPALAAAACSRARVSGLWRRGS